MAMVRALLRRTLRSVFACRLGIMVIIAAATNVTAMTAMTAVTEHMHRNHPGEEQHPNPVLREPFHDLLLLQVN